MDLLVNIDVPELGPAVAFYTRALGLRVGRRFGEDAVELLGGTSPIYLLAKPAGTTPAPAARPRNYARHWTPVHVHLGAAEAMGRVSLLQATGIEPGGSGPAQIVLDRPIGALRGDRFILRDQSAQQTLAGGVVLDPFAPARKVRTPARLAVLAALERPTTVDVLQQLLSVAPPDRPYHVLRYFGNFWFPGEE